MSRSNQKKSKKLPINGVLMLDKPQGLSSNAALQRVKWLFQAAKAGHTGTLDPLATGLLPLCFGQATKVSEYCLGSDKQYVTVIKLGETTDTLDAEGDVLKRKDVSITDRDIAQVIEMFQGDIKQVPPMFSALKKDGQPLYKLARQGQEIERPARDMTVYSLRFERLTNELVKLWVHCSSGFYIRSLAHDIGQALGCGAHVVELRRTAIKQLDVEDAVTLEELLALGEESSELDQFLRPIDCLVQHLPRVSVSRDDANKLKNGQRVTLKTVSGLETTRLYIDDKELFAIASIDDSGLTKTKKIFVEV